MSSILPFQFVYKFQKLYKFNFLTTFVWPTTPAMLSSPDSLLLCETEERKNTWLIRSLWHDTVFPCVTTYFNKDRVIVLILRLKTSVISWWPLSMAGGEDNSDWVSWCGKDCPGLAFPFPGWDLSKWSKGAEQWAFLILCLPIVDAKWPAASVSFLKCIFIYFCQFLNPFTS